MLDQQSLVFEVLPSLIGLVLVVLAVYRILRIRGDFFTVVRSWVLAFFILSLAMLWITELVRFYVGGVAAESHAESDTIFVIFTTWLSVFLIGMTTRYRQYNSLNHFVSWIRNNPLNLITGWGVIGIIFAAAAIAMSPEEHPLSERSLPVVGSAIYLVCSIILDIFLVLKERSGEIMPRRVGDALLGMKVIVIAWIGIPVAELLLDLVGDLSLGYHDYNPCGWVMVGFFVLLLRSVGEKSLTAIVVDPEVEDVKRSGFRAFDIPRGIYLVEDEKSAPALQLFSELVTLPLRPDAAILVEDESPSATLEFLIPRGLIVAREYPESIRKNYNIQVTPIIWLTESPGERRVAPTSLAVLTDTIIRFMESNPNSIILLEGIEYLVTFNDFKKVMRSLDSLNETTWITKTRLLIALDSLAFDTKDLALLERDRKVLRGTKGIEQLKRESRVPGPAP